MMINDISINNSNKTTTGRKVSQKKNIIKNKLKYSGFKIVA